MEKFKAILEYGTIEYKNSSRKQQHRDKYWCLNGELHREDGPAIEYSTGDKFWYLKGKKYSKKEYEKEILKNYVNTEEVSLNFE